MSAVAFAAVVVMAFLVIGALIACVITGMMKLIARYDTTVEE